MLSLIQAADWPIWPIIIASIVAVGIIIERMWALRLKIIAPEDLLPRIFNEYQRNGVTSEMLERLKKHSPLGIILSAGLKNIKKSREIMKESIEESGRVVAHDLNRYLTTLGTIAALSPLMGLFGTLVGMIEIFGSNSPTGSNPAQLAYGISVALNNAAFGILVAIPSMIFYRHFRAKVDGFVLEMELNSPVCQGSTLMLNVVPSGGSGVYTNFSWSGPSGYSSNLQNNNLIASAATSGIYSVTVTDSNGCSGYSDTVAVINDGFGSVHTAPVSVFPNPVGDELILRHITTACYRVELWNLQGQLLQSLGLSCNSGKLPLPSLTPGCYLLRFSNEQGSFQQRLIKR